MSSSKLEGLTMNNLMALKPLYIQINPLDNVAIVANAGGLPRGTEFASGLVLIDEIPEAHKVALVDIAKGQEVRRYGTTIGYANKDIPKGSWVNEQTMQLPHAPSLQPLPICTITPKPAPPLEGYTFEGFVNEDGSVGTKNILGITTTVQCVA